MELDSENRAALQALQNQESLSGGTMPTMLRPRGFTTCPHCREGFGSASFAIHVRRCRALYPTPESGFVAEEEREATAAAPVKPTKPEKIKPVQSLVDLFVHTFIKTADYLKAQHTDVVRVCASRLVQLEEKDAKRRAKMQAMKAEAVSIQRENVRLESFRQQTAVARGRLREQEQISERLRKSLDVLTLEMAAAEAKSQQLRVQYEGFEKQQHRQEAKVRVTSVITIAINSLSLEVDSLKAALKAAQKKETEAIRQLASFAKNANIRSASVASSKSADASSAAKRRLESAHDASSFSSRVTSDVSRKPSSIGKRSNTSASGRSDRSQSGASDHRVSPLNLCMRRRAEATKIPLPATLSTSYLQLLQISSS